LPAPYRVRLRTTNGVERLTEEIRRRRERVKRVIRIFPTRESVVPLVGALLMEAADGAGRGLDHGETLLRHDRLLALAGAPRAAAPVQPGGSDDPTRLIRRLYQ
jgi:transposase-like protein